MRPLQSDLVRAAIVAAIVASAIGSLCLMAEFYGVSSTADPALSMWVLLVRDLVMLVFLLLAWIAIPVSLLFLISWKHARRSALIGLTWAAVLMLILTGISMLEGEVRRAAFLALTERSAPLIAAIDRYERDHGAPPDSLAILVPSYMPSVPSTGMGAYPSYEYLHRKDAVILYGDRWALVIDTPTGVINFDEFYYLPSRRYPARVSGYVERVGNWAYFHE
jgi:hypothetical protein